MRIINTYTEYLPTDNVLSPDEIIDICCAPVGVNECSETGRVSPYEGADDEHRDFNPDDALGQARADNPGKRILSVQAEGIGNRPGQPCGELHESWQDRLNCCDFVVPIEWDHTRSAAVIGRNGTARVVVSGGVPPYRWKIRGEGFTFDGYNQREAVTESPIIDVYTNSIACGWAPITVTDGCTSEVFGIRCTVGQWIRDVYASPCTVPGIGTHSWGAVTESISGQYKVSQLCGENSIGCTYFWLDPCTEAQILATAAYICSTYLPDEPPCFALPAGVTDCGNGIWWKKEPFEDRSVRFYVFSDYTVWRWVC